jgi:folate-dependent phosphoribosylglycinamide formyltransferase PurN
MKWCTFFSQTGTEIVEICTALQRWPDKICTNKSISDIDSINPKLLEACYKNIMFLPNKPKVEEYSTSLRNINLTDIITLHGYLKIIPKYICDRYTIYNGHPGDIVSYPELKGFNPQEKAYKLKIKNTGSVIHKVTSVVDDGPVVEFKPCKIHLKSLDETYKILHANSVSLWVDFLKKTLKIKK